MQEYNILYPIKTLSIRRWIDDLSFKYCLNKKSYMINIHEREDVCEDRKKYIQSNFILEINELY